MWHGPCLEVVEDQAQFAALHWNGVLLRIGDCILMKAKNDSEQATLGRIKIFYEKSNVKYVSFWRLTPARLLEADVKTGQECAQVKFSNSVQCPICDQVLSSNGVSAVELAPSTDKMINLCGMEPRFVLEASSRAIEFWNFQKELEVTLMQKEAKELRGKYQQAERAAEDKIQALQSQQRLLSDQLEALRQERDKNQREIAELNEKYAAKARQKRKLEELYTTLKQAGDAAKRVSSPVTTRVRASSPAAARPTQLPARVDVPRASLAPQTGSPLDSLDKFSLLRRKRLSAASPPSHTFAGSASPNALLAQRPQITGLQNRPRLPFQSNPSPQLTSLGKPRLPTLLAPDARLVRPETPLLLKRRTFGGTSLLHARSEPHSHNEY